MKKATTDTIGCDLGDRYSEICVLSGKGKLERHRIQTTQVGMELFFRRPRAHVVIEVGTHSRWVSSMLEQLGHRVTVANARRVKLISESDSKNDRKDAELLARLGRADPELLAPIEHRGKDAQQALAIIKARDELVCCRTKLVNFARGLVKSFGLRLARCETEAFHKKTKELIPNELRAALDPVLEAIGGISAQIKTHDKLLARAAKAHPGFQAVTQPTGVGILTGLAFVLTIDDKTRFKKSRQVGAFFGLRPRQDQTGDSDKQLRISKAGDQLMRRLLVNSANYVLGPFGPDCDLRRWGMKLAERGGKNAKKRATVAVARKLAVLMHRLWVTGAKYDPLREANKTPLAS
jgi:transposase